MSLIIKYQFDFVLINLNPLSDFHCCGLELDLWVQVDLFIRNFIGMIHFIHMMPREAAFTIEILWDRRHLLYSAPEIATNPAGCALLPLCGLEKVQIRVLVRSQSKDMQRIIILGLIQFPGEHSQIFLIGTEDHTQNLCLINPPIKLMFQYPTIGFPNLNIIPIPTNNSNFQPTNTKFNTLYLIKFSLNLTLHPSINTIKSHIFFVGVSKGYLWLLTLDTVCQ